MSKKIAEGIGGLVLDVKTGAGAFMKTPEASRRLAEALVAIGEANGVRTEALISSMDAPLGRAVGNANEVIESIEALKGSGPADLERLSVLLAARMLIVAGISGDEQDAESRVVGAMASGAGVEKFRRIIQNQGGDPRVVDVYRRLPLAPDQAVVRAERAGYVSTLDAEMVGRAAVALGAGRGRLEDVIDHGVGIDVVGPPGTAVRTGDPVFEIRHRNGRGMETASALLREAIHLSDEAPAARPLIVDRIQGRG
jgi:thymidine phosphorylase